MTDAQAILAAALINAECALLNGHIASMQAYDRTNPQGGYTEGAYQDVVNESNLNNPQVYFNRVLELVP